MTGTRPLPGPGPEPTVDDAGFWDGCRRHVLQFQRCRHCGRHRHPPTPVCAACHSFDVDWAPQTGPARLFSFTVVHHAVTPELAGHVPYTVAVVEFPDLGGIRLISNVVDADPTRLAIGIPLALVWEPADNGIPLPRFRPAR